MNFKLVPLSGVKSTLLYDLQGLEGAMQHAFAAPEVAQRLFDVSYYLNQHCVEGEEVELLVWDAFRSRQTQQAIYDRYVLEIVRLTGCSYEEAYVKASSFVSLPTSIYPHGTGGALDVTLLVNRKEAFMGSGFDDFVPHSAADWYRENPPQNVADEMAARNRELLRSAMESVGFVGLFNEWWHYEWGTARWAEATQQPVVLGSILSPPQVEGPTVIQPQVPHRQPVWQLGAAQVFNSPVKRSDALLHREPGHYYARTSHPTVEALGAYIKESVLPSQHVALTTSGLSACVAALKSFVPRNGHIAYDAYIYYEVEREILALATDFGWQTTKVDFKDIDELSATVDEGRKVDVLFCDHPRNWWLDGLDIKALSLLSQRLGSTLIVDTSVQPLQDLMGLGANVVVCSLSKYPSLSLTLGGAVLCDTPHLHNALCYTLSRDGNVLSPDSAATIWSQIVSLKDRMSAVSTKATEIAAFLDTHPGVRQVRLPNAQLCGGFTGGQLTFHAQSYEVGRTAEKIVGYNSLQNRAAIHLACTFGASITTFEHFASNVRHRTGVPREATNEICLPDDIVRIGVGCESAAEIIADLSFVLNAAWSHINS